MNKNLITLIEKHSFPSSTFSLKDFLFSEGLEINLIGTGFTREVYEVIGTELVLKVAISKSGLNQNKTETHSAFKKYPQFFNIPIANNKDYSITITPKAIAFPADKEELVYEGLYNLDDDELDCYMANVLEDWEVKRMFERISSYAKEIMAAWLDIHSNSELTCFGLPADYGKSCSYGTVNGIVKIIDFGLTDFTYIN